MRAPAFFRAIAVERHLSLIYVTGLGVAATERGPLLGVRGGRHTKCFAIIIQESQVTVDAKGIPIRLVPRRRGAATGEFIFDKVVWRRRCEGSRPRRGAGRRSGRRWTGRSTGGADEVVFAQFQDAAVRGAVTLALGLSVGLSAQKAWVFAVLIAVRILVARVAVVSFRAESDAQPRVGVARQRRRALTLGVARPARGGAVGLHAAFGHLK